MVNPLAPSISQVRAAPTGLLADRNRSQRQYRQPHQPTPPPPQPQNTGQAAVAPRQLGGQSFPNMQLPVGIRPMPMQYGNVAQPGNGVPPSQQAVTNWQGRSVAAPNTQFMTNRQPRGYK